jgi:hypothetical protein
MSFIINPYRYGSGSGADPNFSSVTLLMHCDGANGSTTFTDNSPLARTITPSGNAQISTAKSKFGGASALFDGSGDFLNATYASSPIGAADFTVEFWLNPNAVAADYNVLSVASGTNVNAFIGNDSTISSGRGIRFVVRNDAQATNIDIRSTGIVTTVGTWAHVACVIEGAVGRIYVDGVQKDSGAVGGSRTATFTGLNVGYLHSSATRYYNGYIDEMRITKGVCRYPGGTSFTPQTAAFPNS